MARWPDQKHVDMLDRAASHLRAVLDEVPADADERRTLELALERTEQGREAAADKVHGTGASSDTAVNVGGSVASEGGV